MFNSEPVPSTSAGGPTGGEHIETAPKPIIAVSIDAQDFDSRAPWARDNSFAIEYTPDPLSPGLIARHVSTLGGAVPLRFHCRFGGYELGTADPAAAAEALEVHLRAMQAMADVGGTFVTVHLNFKRDVPFDEKTAVGNLTRLVEFAAGAGMTVAVENLKYGAASDPASVLGWAEASGAMITLDMGHAVSCELVKSGALRVEDFVEIFSGRLREAHIYGKEEDRHYPLDDAGPLEPALSRLLASGCDWWTVELNDNREALATRNILEAFLKKAIAGGQDVI